MLNVALGLGYVLSGIALNFYVYPKLTQIYDEFEQGTRLLASYQSGRVISTVILIGISLLNLYFGVRLFQKNNKTKERDVMYGLAAIGGIILLGGIAVGYMSQSIIGPMYTLTESY